MTVMPRLRLSPQDAEDVASYLITLQRPGAAPNPPASFMGRIPEFERGR